MTDIVKVLYNKVYKYYNKISKFIFRLRETAG